MVVHGDRALVGRPWTDREGRTRVPRRATSSSSRPTTPMSPSSTGVAEGASRAPPVGTVDKFQGHEAPVAIYSMTTSSTEDAPRGMEFLYPAPPQRRHLPGPACRTRRQPGAASGRCRTPEQMRLANALCRYVELADEQERDDDRAVVVAPISASEAGELLTLGF